MRLGGRIALHVKVPNLVLATQRLLVCSHTLLAPTAFAARLFPIQLHPHPPWPTAVNSAVLVLAPTACTVEGVELAVEGNPYSARTAH